MDDRSVCLVHQIRYVGLECPRCVGDRQQAERIASEEATRAVLREAEARRLELAELDREEANARAEEIADEMARTRAAIEAGHAQSARLAALTASGRLEASELLKQAANCLRMADRARATTCITRAIDRAPDYPWARLMEAYLRRGTRGGAEALRSSVIAALASGVRELPVAWKSPGDDPEADFRALVFELDEPPHATFMRVLGGSRALPAPTARIELERYESGVPSLAQNLAREDAHALRALLAEVEAHRLPQALARPQPSARGQQWKHRWAQGLAAAIEEAAAPRASDRRRALSRIRACIGAHRAALDFIESELARREAELADARRHSDASSAVDSAGKGPGQIAARAAFTTMRPLLTPLGLVLPLVGCCVWLPLASFFAEGRGGLFEEMFRGASIGAIVGLLLAALVGGVTFLRRHNRETKLALIAEESRARERAAAFARVIELEQRVQNARESRDALVGR